MLRVSRSAEGVHQSSHPTQPSCCGLVVVIIIVLKGVCGRDDIDMAPRHIMLGDQRSRSEKLAK